MERFYVAEESGGNSDKSDPLPMSLRTSVALRDGQLHLQPKWTESSKSSVIIGNTL